MSATSYHYPHPQQVSANEASSGSTQPIGSDFPPAGSPEVPTEVPTDTTTAAATGAGHARPAVESGTNWADMNGNGTNLHAGDLLDSLLDECFEELEHLGAERAGVETLEVVGEELGVPAGGVFRNGVAEILLLPGALGPAYAEQTVSLARSGRLSGVGAGGHIILVRPAASADASANASANANLYELYEQANKLGIGVAAGPRQAAGRVVELLLGVSRQSNPTESNPTESTESKDTTQPPTPSSGRPAQETAAVERPAAAQGSAAAYPHAHPQAHPHGYTQGHSAKRDFDLVSGPGEVGKNGHEVERDADAFKAAASGGRPGEGIFSPEEREAILEAREAVQKSADVRKGFTQKCLNLVGLGGRSASEDVVVRIPEPVVYPPLSPEVIRRMHHSPYPSVFAFVNNKGGVGKTSVAIGTAAAFSQMGSNPAGPESLRVLVVEQNFLNPDIESRMQLRPGSIRGLGAYFEDLLTAWESKRFSPDHEPFDIKPYTSKSYVENLDVLLIGSAEDERRIAEDYLPEDAFQAVFCELYRSLGASYDVVCVDLANSRPESDKGEAAKSSSARCIGFWISAVDGVYVPFDASKTSYEQARRVAHEAKSLCEESDDAVGVPPMAGVIPILNFFPEQRRGDLTWMEDDEEAARTLEHEYLPKVGADHARLPGFAPGSATLKIPNYKEVTYYNNAGRIPCLESARFARAYIPIVMDASSRAYENQGIRAQAIQ